MSEFLQMGGYAPYVWASYLLGLLVVVITIWLPWREERRVWRQLGRRQQRGEQIRESETS